MIECAYKNKIIMTGFLVTHWHDMDGELCNTLRYSADKTDCTILLKIPKRLSSLRLTARGFRRGSFVYISGKLVGGMVIISYISHDMVIKRQV